MASGKKTSLAERLVPLARAVRSAGYKSLAPLDYLFGRVNQLGKYPPIHLRRFVGGMSAGFNGPGYEFVAYLRLLANLRAGDTLWDLACGCGMLELALEDQGWDGTLIGTDISKPSIDWCNHHIARRRPGFRFLHMDIYNQAYHRTGKLNTQQWLDSFTQKNIDIVIAKSLFTHVLPNELDIYLQGIFDRLKPGATALLTFFVQSEDTARFAASGHSSFNFQPYGDGRCAVYRPSAPTAAVAYDKTYLEQRMQHAGFRVTENSHHPGSWSGNPNGLSFQDIFVIEKT